MYGRCTCKSENTYSMNNVCPTNKGSPVHVAPACVGSREGSDHFGSIVQSFLNPWPLGHKAAALPLRQGSPSCAQQIEQQNKLPKAQNKLPRDYKFYNEISFAVSKLLAENIQVKMHKVSTSGQWTIDLLCRKYFKTGVQISMVYSICTENNGIVSSTNTSSELLVNWEYSELLTVEIFFSLGFIEGINYCGWLAGWLFIIIRLI